MTRKDVFDSSQKYIIKKERLLRPLCSVTLMSIVSSSTVKVKINCGKFDRNQPQGAVSIDNYILQILLFTNWGFGALVCDSPMLTKKCGVTRLSITFANPKVSCFICIYIYIYQNQSFNLFFKKI